MTLMVDLALKRRCAQVVANMSMLSNADGSIMREQGVRRAPPSGGSRIPKGVSLKATPPGPPSEDRDPAAHWAYRFRRARDARHLWALVVMAERAYIVARYGARPSEKPEDMEARVLRDYEGVAALEAALLEGCDATWLRKLRTASGRNPTDGRLDSKNGARDRAIAMRAEGATWAEIAAESGIASTTLRRMVNGSDDA